MIMCKVSVAVITEVAPAMSGHRPPLQVEFPPPGNECGLNADFVLLHSGKSFEIQFEFQPIES